MLETNASISQMAAPAGASTNALRDIKPPVEIPSGWAWVAWGLAVLLALAAAVLAWKYWRWKRDQVPIVPPVPPHIRARRALEEALSLISQPNPFCTRVSGTIRTYLEERFDFHAPERTTEEFLYELQGSNLLLPDQKEHLGKFLQYCDLVKFAKYEPAETELLGLHAAAVRLVEETEPLEQPAAGAATPIPAAEPGAAGSPGVVS